MSFISFTIDLKYVGQQLRRIADALEAVIPPPGESVELKPEEAVTYVDEQRIANQEIAEATHKLEQWLRENPVEGEEEEQEEADGMRSDV